MFEELLMQNHGQRVIGIIGATLTVAAFSAGVVQAEVTATRMLEESVAIDDVSGLTVLVDNVFGPVRVTAHDRNVVDMRATEALRADTQADLDRARAEVELRTVREDGRVAFQVRRPNDSCGADCTCRCNSWDGYIAVYDIEVVVPRDAAIEVKTVNNGDIVIDGVRGDFDVRNVNGAVQLSGLRGAGRATTVNGPVEASFERAPAAATSFKTINGEIDVSFPGDLAADLEFKTMHGEIYTDFDVEPLARAAVGERTQDGATFLIRAQRPSAVRIGRGGPTHSFETLNGDIYIREGSR
jgi:hypothetical protein